MANKKIRVAVVGAGHVAQIGHLPAYKSHRDVELVAIVDDDPVKARNVGAQHGVEKAYEDFTEMLEHEELDAVDLCTPNFLHAPMAIAALRSGLHVLCEKPLARSAAEARRMVETAKKHKRILMAAMNNRFRSDVQVLQRFIKRGELGNIQLVKAGWRRTARDWRERRWFMSEKQAGGGALLDLGTPVMDLAVWIADLKKPTRVNCSTYGKVGRGGVEQSACAMVNFAGGSCLLLEVTWNVLEPGDHSYIQIFGSKGTANVHPLKMYKSMHGHLVNVTPELTEVKNLYKESFKEEINHFIECVQRRRQPLTSGQEALSVLTILDAMYESASSGREVKFR